MSKKNPTSSKKSNTSDLLAPIKRLDIRLMVFIQLIAALVLFIALNYLSAHNYKRTDLTQHSDFTLSELTRNYLASDSITERKKPLKIIAAFRKSSPHYARVKAILSEYQHLSSGAIDLEYVDPVRDKERADQIADLYDIHFTSDLILIDGTPAPKENNASASKSSTDVANTIANNQAHLRVITDDDIVIQRADKNSQLKIIGYQDEDALTSALIGAVEGTPRRIYFLSDKSDLESAGDDAPWKELRRLLIRQNILLEPLKIADLETLADLPKDLAGIALIAPQYDLDERELELLKQYWLTPRSALFIVLNPSSRPPRLRSFLREHGISQSPDRILTVKNGRVRTDVRAAFTLKADANQGLGGTSTTFEGNTGSLDVREGSEELLNKKIFALSLIQSSPDYWGETKFKENNPTFDKLEDNPGPLTLAAGVIRGNATSQDDPTQGRNANSRLVVINNSSFLHPDRLREEQTDFIQNSINWLIGRPDLAGVGPRGLRLYKLNLVDSQLSFINKVNLFLIPAALLLIALFVWNTRRA